MQSGSSGTRCSPSSSPTQASKKKNADSTCSAYACVLVAQVQHVQPCNISTSSGPFSRLRGSPRISAVQAVRTCAPSIEGLLSAPKLLGGRFCVLQLCSRRSAEAIHQAAFAGDAKILKKMVDCGANPGDFATLPGSCSACSGHSLAVEWALTSLARPADPRQGQKRRGAAR